MSKASAALPQWAVGFVSGSMTGSSSMIEPGVAAGIPGRRVPGGARHPGSLLSVAQCSCAMLPKLIDCLKRRA